MKKIFFLLFFINTISASASTPTSNAQITPISPIATIAANSSMSSIVVNTIYSPLKLNGTADDTLSNNVAKIETIQFAKVAKRPWRIAFLFPHLKDPYWIGSNYGVISEAKRLGIQADIFVAKGYNDLMGQLSAMDEAIAGNYDAIVISPISLTANNASILKAKAMGIPIFQMGNDSTSGALTSKITSSLKDMGLKAMQWVVEDAQRRGLTAINIALLPGPEDAGWVKGEVDGTMEIIKNARIKIKLLAIKYGDSDRILQTQLARKMLFQFGENLHYVIGCSGCAPAVIQPLNELQLQNKISIVAYDLTQEIKEHIRKGHIKAAADTKAVSQAKVAIHTAINFLENRHVIMPHTILIPIDLVDANNFKTYPFQTSLAPFRYTPQIFYKPKNKLLH